MTVYDFCYLCTDDSAEVSIYDMNPVVENEVFKGPMSNAMYSTWEDFEVFCFDLDPQAGLILNIYTSMG